VLNRAVCWGLLDFNTAKLGVPNPPRRATEKRPFETWRQVEAVAAQLGPVYGPMVIFAAATGLRPSCPPRLRERPAEAHEEEAEHAGGAAAGESAGSARPAAGIGQPDPLSDMRGGWIDFRIFGRKHWRPAQTKAGIDPIRGLYDLRHTYATFALRAGVPVFAVSRFMGTSISMIDAITAISPTTAASTPSRFWMRSGSSGRWTLRGRRRECL
jgi:integrase